MIIIDTGPIVAFFDKDDNHHHACLEVLKEIKEPLVTTCPVITEAFYLLNFSWRTQDALWEFIHRDGILVEPLDKNSYSVCRELMKKYHDLPIDFADASLVALAEAKNITTVFTLDHKDFSLLKPKHRKSFTLLPTKL